MKLRLNSADAPLAGDPERVTEGRTEYLRVPVAASREQILAYEDTPNAYDREYLPGDELAAGASRTNTVDTTLNHPLVASASGGIQTCLTSTPGAQYACVGEFRNLRMNDAGTKLLGALMLPVEGRDEHGDEYRDAFDTLEAGGEVGVSLGYAPGEVDPTPGRYNGEHYDAIQRAPEIDHLALITSGKPRCSVEAGCAAGRANAEPIEAAVGTPVVTDGGATTPSAQERDTGRIAGALETLGAALGVGVETRTNAESKTVAGVTFTSKKSGKLTKTDIPGDDFESHFLYAGDTKSDSSYPVVDGSGALRKGNVSSAYQMGARGGVSEDDLHKKLKALNKQWPEDEHPIDFTDRENATRYDEGDVVEYGDGKLGVVLAVMTGDFTWPQGEDDEIDVEVSSDETAYVVARESGGAQVFWGDELSAGSFDTEAPSEEELSDLRSNADEYAPDWYDNVGDLDDLNEVRTKMRENADIPGVDDPGVGFDRLPKGWTRKSVLQAYIHLGGSWRSCVAGMTGEIRSPKKFCSKLKDEVYQSERWRGRF